MVLSDAAHRYWDREGLQTHESLTRLKFDFLVKDYELPYYYFECVEMLRKVMLVGFIAFFVRSPSILVSSLLNPCTI